jgi:putative peptidoglycan lipid II flippase
LVGIKVLAPGFYASQDMRTPVRIAIAVLVLTQLMNLALVPLFRHAGLALSIGLGALINAAWLLIGLRRRASWRPAAGWGRFLLQVIAATALMAVFLMWAGAQFSWTELRAQAALRVALLAGLLTAAIAIYFGALWAAGVQLRQFVTR